MHARWGLDDDGTLYALTSRHIKENHLDRTLEVRVGTFAVLADLRQNFANVADELVVGLGNAMVGFSRSLPPADDSSGMSWSPRLKESYPSQTD